MRLVGRKAYLLSRVSVGSRGPLGYGMGKVEIVRHDGKGHLTSFWVIFGAMNDQAFVDLRQVI